MLKRFEEPEDLIAAVRVIYHHEGDGWWAESPDVLEHDAPAGESVPA